MAKSYFAILGVAVDASPKEIQAAYRRLVKEFHPDRYTGGSKPFRNIQEAYAVLGDPDRRDAYEQTLEKNRPRNPSTPEPLIPDPSPANFGDISPVRSFARYAPSSDEIFDWLWHNFDNLDQPKSGRIENLTLEVPLSMEQALAGGNATVMVPARAACPSCLGTGTVNVYPCERCAGEGAIAGEVPVRIAFPAGLVGDHSVVIPLERFGIKNLHMTVVFRSRDTQWR